MIRLLFMLVAFGALAGIVAIGWWFVTQLKSGGGSGSRRDDLDRVDRGE